MTDLPQNPELLVEGHSESFDFGDSTMPESFTVKEAASAGVNSDDRQRTGGLLFDVVIPLGLLAVAGLILLLLGTVQPEQRAAADNSRAGRLRALPPVDVQPVQSLDLLGSQLQLRVDGTVIPYREAKVATEVAGRIVYKADECEAGAYVTKDMVLMRIDPTDYELEVQRLTRMKTQEYEAIQEVVQEMTNIKRLIEVAQDDFDLQQKEVDRKRELASRGFGSAAEFDQANRALLQAKQQLVTWENQSRLLEKRRTKLEVSEQLAATQLRAAEINLARTEIKALIDGVIVSEDAEINTFVARGSPLVTIEDTSKVEVAISLRMDQLYWVLDQERQAGGDEDRGYDLPETPALIEYELAGRENVVYRWKGKLLSYDGIGLDPKTRTVPVRVVVDQPRRYMDESGEEKSIVGPGALVRGMYVKVKLLIEPQTPLVVIPAKAIKPGNRVWQFLPDDTVLDLSDEDQPEDKEEPDEAALADQGDKTAGKDENADEKFVAEDWRAGRVVVRRAVTPVDSLSIDFPREKGAEGDTRRTDGEQRMWVCEVPDQAIEDGSFVVTSPLGFVDTDTVPARAQAATIGDVNTEASRRLVNSTGAGGGRETTR